MSVMDDIKERNKVIQIIMQNLGIIHKVANMFCKRQEDKDDLIQEIMTQLWSSFEKYDNAYKIGTWIYRVSINIAISHRSFLALGSKRLSRSPGICQIF